MKRNIRKSIAVILSGLLLFAAACEGPTENPLDPAEVTQEEFESTEETETVPEETTRETTSETETESVSETSETETETVEETTLSGEYDAGRVDCSGLDTESGGFAVVDENGKCYMGREELTSFRPASITKVLTALVAAEHLDLDAVTEVSQNAVTMIDVMSSGVSPSLKPGEHLTVRDLLYALILPSTNAAANVLAEAVSGSIPAFTELMNQKAAELGCKNSSFQNPHGLDEEGHLSCPYDMALILRAALENETLKKILSAVSYEIAPTEYTGARTLSMGHAMVAGTYNCPGVFAGKTGSTVLAGKTLVTAVERDGKRFYICTMHSMENHQYMDTDNIIRYAYAKWTQTKTNLLAYAYDIHLTTTDGLGMAFSYKVSNLPKKIVNATWPLAQGVSGAKFNEQLTMNRESNVLSLSGLSYGTYAVQFLVTNANGEESSTMVNILHCGALLPEGVQNWNGGDYLLDAGNVVNTGVGETTSAAYFAGPDGLLKKGLVSGKYFAGEDYRLITGWQKVGEDTYYFQPDGRMATGDYFVDGDLYRFTNEGKLIDTEKEGVGE